MDKSIFKELAESVRDFVRGEVSRIENRLDSLRADVENIPPPRDGKDGKDGETIVGPEGPAGRDGIDGKDGESLIGPQGPEGPAGRDGIDGKDGESIEGPQGPAGESIQGEKGERGEQGPKGDSVKGDKGDTGEQGPAGLGVDTPLWEDRVYREGEEVQHHFGQFFRALKDTAQNPDSSDWERIGSNGFRLTGSHSKEFEYLDGDLFVKDFGLFLYKGGEATCIAGRGPQGKAGKAGPKGRDGSDGVDGKDGSEIDLLELRGSNLVAIVKSADGELKDHIVSLDPFLQTAALVTKEIQSETNKEVIEHADQYVRKLWDSLNTHLEDEDATPISFYRGLWKVDTSYAVGDWVRYGTEGFLCKRAHTGVIPHNYPNTKQDASEYWSAVAGMMTHGAYSGGEGGGGDGSGSIGVVPTYALVTEGGSGGTKFSQFAKSTEGEVIKGVGFQDSKGNVQFELTTDAVKVNPNPFRNAKGQFIGTPEELDALKNQRDVNEFLYNAINEIESGDIDLEGYATEVQLNEVDAASIERDEKLKDQIDELAAGDVDLSPVEDRLDDIEAVLPKTPAVIDPVEIGEQTLKITGNRPSGAGGEAGSVLMWKAEAGSGGSPYNECKFVVPDTSVIDPDAPSIWWKQGDKVQRWDMGGAGWLTGGNVLHYSAAETFGDTLVDGLPIELYYIDPTLTGDDLIDTISRVESKADDRKLQVEIEEIALALETLLVQREHGQWKYTGFTGDTIPSNAGEFGLLVEDIGSSQDNVITINQEDLKGITHGFADVEVGDYVEIVNTDEPTSYALFVVTKAPEGTGIVNVEVGLKDKGYNIWIGETCEIRFFAINEQDLNLTDLDNRYLKLSGGTMTGILELPRFNVKKHDGEAVCLIEGKVDGQTTSARLTFSNKINANAYGTLSWNGNSGQGWFQFNKDIDFSTKGLHSVNHIRMSGAKTIQEATNTRIKFENKVVITKTGTNRAGFVLKGGVDGNSDGNLLSVYHNSSGLDSVDYYGKQEGENNVATVGYVNSKVGSGGGSPVTAKLQSGIQMWSGSRLSEGCFNLLDENLTTTNNCKIARGLTFHTYQGFDEWPWMHYALRSGGQIHLTDMNGKYLMSKPVLSAEKHDAGSGDNPADALWFFELSIYGFEAETSLSGLYMLEFENCLEAG